MVSSATHTTGKHKRKLAFKEKHSKLREKLVAEQRWSLDILKMETDGSLTLITKPS